MIEIPEVPLWKERQTHELQKRIDKLEVQVDNLKSYIENTEAVDKWYLDGEITWKEFATAMENENKRLREGEDIWRVVAARNEAEFRTLGEENQRLRKLLDEMLEDFVFTVDDEWGEEAGRETKEEWATKMAEALNPQEADNG